jgi:outer membrane protein assembly factor BamB
MGPGKNVAWRTAIPNGFSSPVLSGSRIFLTAVENEALFTIALDRATGKVLWRREAPRPRREQMHKPNTPANPSPATDGESVFVFFGDFGLLAYTMDGQERWRLPLGPFNNQNGHGSSPIVAADLVVLICDQDTGSYIVAVDKRTGKVRWKTSRPGITRGYGTPAYWTPSKGPAQIIATGAYQLISYDLKTGARLWWVTGMAWQVKGVPIVVPGPTSGATIYVNTWESGGDFETPPPVDAWEVVLERYDADKDGRLSPSEISAAIHGFNDYDLNKDGFLDREEWDAYTRLRNASNNLMAIKLEGGETGDLTSKVLWRHRKTLPNIPSPLLYAGALFLVKDGGLVTTLNPQTGEIFKQGRIAGAVEQYWSSPVAADGKVYMLSQSCKLSVLSGQPQWEVLRVNDIAGDADGECFATPAIAGGALYVRTRGWLYCFRQGQESK